MGLAGRWRYASRWSLPATWQLRRTRPLPATRTNRRLVVTATSSCAVETDPGLVGQVGDALGPEHRRELAKHAWQPPGRHHRDTVHDHLAPGDLGAVDGHDRHHHHVGVGQNLDGLISFELHRLEYGGKRVEV